MKFFIFGLFFSYILLAQVGADDVQNLKITDLKKISSWMVDKKTPPRIKVLILEKLNILLLNNQEEVPKNSTELLIFLETIFKNYSNDSSSYDHLLRKKSCLILSYFYRTEKEEDAYTLIKNQIFAEKNGDVAAACIRVISDFDSSKDETNKFLLKILDTSLKKKKPSEDDIESAVAIIDVLEKFNKKQSYLVLLKILESKYPTDIKNQAKKTLEKLPQ